MKKGVGALVIVLVVAVLLFLSTGMITGNAIWDDWFSFGDSSEEVYVSDEGDVFEGELETIRDVLLAYSYGEECMEYFSSEGVGNPEVSCKELGNLIRENENIEIVEYHGEIGDFSEDYMTGNVVAPQTGWTVRWYPGCTDSDGGDDWEVKGVMYNAIFEAVDPATNKLKKWKLALLADSCFTGASSVSYQREYFCNGFVPAMKDSRCAVGCKKGECKACERMKGPIGSVSRCTLYTQESIFEQGYKIRLEDVFSSSIKVNGQVIGEGFGEKLKNTNKVIYAETAGYHANDPFLSQAIFRLRDESHCVAQGKICDIYLDDLVKVDNNVTGTNNTNITYYLGFNGFNNTGTNSTNGTVAMFSWGASYSSSPGGGGGGGYTFNVLLGRKKVISFGSRNVTIVPVVPQYDSKKPWGSAVKVVLI